MLTYLITGGAGFVGTNLCHFLLESKHDDIRVVGFDKLVHGYNQQGYTDSRYTFYQTDVCNAADVTRILHNHDVNIVIHLAAQVSVDASFENAFQFTQDNVVGTQVLLECCRSYGQLQRFLFFSTDEVYGEATADDTIGSLENAVLNPMNPYAATKVGAESLVRAYSHSFGLPNIITRANNIYGPYQSTKALIPAFTERLIARVKCNIHGKGTTKRYFIHVRDICHAIVTILEKGSVNEIYNISSSDEFSVCQIHTKLIEVILPGEKPEDLRQFIVDRPHNDTRYMINDGKLHALGWKQTISFEEGMRSTVEWYKQHIHYDSPTGE